MREHIRLGRVAGVDVGLNYSVLAIFLLITLGLATGRFPALFPDQAQVSYWVAGLAAGMLFFVSLLTHEVSHAVVARHFGLEVDTITLWLFGGVANLEGEAPDPAAELRIAGVGPLVSLVLAGAFWIVAVGLAAAGLPGLVADVSVWLAVINLMLAVFNVMPAAPLDGGRILRAFLWRRRGDRTSAAITAARAGRGFGWFVVGPRHRPAALRRLRRPVADAHRLVPDDGGGGGGAARPDPARARRRPGRRRDVAPADDRAGVAPDRPVRRRLRVPEPLLDVPTHRGRRSPGGARDAAADQGRTRRGARDDDPPGRGVRTADHAAADDDPSPGGRLASGGHPFEELCGSSAYPSSTCSS